MAKDFTVAIVGGGLSGLAAAYPLSRAGISVKVFEAAPKFEEIGAGVGFGPNAIRTLESLGLLDVILAHSDQTEPIQRLFKFIEGPAPHNLVFDYETKSSTNVGLGIYRPALLDALISVLDPSIVQFNKRCASIVSTNRGLASIQFTDGTTHEADIVIGADGIRSVTRHFVIGEDARPLVFANTWAYRGIVPNEDLIRAGMKTDLSLRPTCYVGKGKHIICFPIQGGKVINFVAFVARHDLHKGPEVPMPWVQSRPHKELKEQYGDWGPEGQIIVDHIKNPSRWSIHACIPPLKSYVRERVVLTHKGNLDQILACYNEVRPPRASDVLMRSTRAAEIYDNYGAGGYNNAQMQEHLQGQWEPVWNYDVREVFQESIRGLEKKGVFSSVRL
ncbi:hypothetical protein PQX77_009891 [Marasmius sp. AFHP31]|nr:hypothetical protein PQX77_009891 [Marasmius sp. AFHP31]